MIRGRILYIEDNLENRVLVKRVLEAEGFSVHVAENGVSGVGEAQTLQPDLILMDINLPDIDGYEATKRLRKLSKLDRTPIIALTANVMEGDRQKALDAGLDGYIPKPIDIDALPRQIDEHIRLGVMSQNEPVTAASAEVAKASAPSFATPVQPAPDAPAGSRAPASSPPRPSGMGAPPPPPPSAPPPPPRTMPPGPPPPPPSAPPTMKPMGASAPREPAKPADSSTSPPANTDALKPDAEASSKPTEVASTSEAPREGA